jgi:hypothetical protein
MLFRPSRFRMIYLPLNLVACWAAAFFKARAGESWPWVALFLITIFILGILAVEVWISSCFSEFLIPALFGFLAGAGANAVIQGLLGKFQGLNWAFQSPIQFSLGTVLFGFLGSLIFISYGDQVRRIFSFLISPSGQIRSKSHLRTFSAIVWVVTVLIALALCASLVAILEQFSELASPNPLRKPLWFHAGAVVLVLLLAAFARKSLIRIGLVLLPGIILGMFWAFIIRDVYEGLLFVYPQFPIASEVLEFVLIINFCFLGIAWLNKAAHDSC